MRHPADRPRAPRSFRAAVLGPLLATLVALGGCVVGTPDGVQPVTPFDPVRYQGTWYEVARLDHRFERGLTNVTATYSLNDDGTVRVVNRGFRPGDCEWDDVVGEARFLGAPDVASLGVSFFGPFRGGYHVFALDQAGYQHALVSGPSRDYLWILARTPSLPPAIRDSLVATARAAGFPVDELIFVEHGPPRCADGGSAPPAPPAAE